MKVYFYCLAFIIPFLSLAQTNQKDAQGKRHGVWQKKFENGKLRYEGQFEHGIEVGEFKHYFDNGDLKVVNVFRGKTRVAYSRLYGGREKLAAEGLYIKGKRDSVWTFYDADGNVISREEYKVDLKEGKSYSYYKNEKIAEMTTFTKDLKDGEWKQFYEDGRPKSKGQYSSNKLTGQVIYYNEQGRVRAKGNYVRGLMDGNWYIFDENMKVKEKQIWRRGIHLNREVEEIEGFTEE